MIDAAPEEPASRRSRWWGLGAHLGWAALLVAILLGRAWTSLSHPVVGHPDEPYWIGSTYYYHLLRRGDIASADWQLLPALENPPVGKYLFGVAAEMTGRRVRSIDVLGGWTIVYLLQARGRGERAAYDKRLELVDRMDPRNRQLALSLRFHPLGTLAVGACRIVSFSAGVLTTLLIAALGAMCGRVWAGRLAALLFTFHPEAFICYTNALVDMIALGFATLAVLVLVRLWDRPGPRSGVGGALGLGVVEGLALGLAVGSKMNALLVMMLAGLVWVVLLGEIIGGDRRRLASWLALGLAFPLAAALFLAINPTMYPDPAAGVRALFATQAEAVRFQAAFLPDHAATLPEKFRTLAELLTGGRGALVLLVLVTAWRTAAAAAGRSPGGWWIIAAWWWIALVAVGVWIPFPWRRYALPLLPPALLLVGDAVVAIVRAAARHAWPRSAAADRMSPGGVPC